MDPVRTVFFGTGAFAVPILEALRARADIEIVGVIAPPDRAGGRTVRSATLRASPVVLAARAAGLSLLQVNRVRAPEAVQAIGVLLPDLGVLADFGQLIPPSILDLPRLGILNVHPSLLPRHRGATPIPATILAGDPAAGVSIIKMDLGLDTGPVVGSRSWALNGTEDAPGIEARAATEGASLLGEVLGAMFAGHLNAMPQDASAATMTHPFVRESGRLNAQRSAAELERQVRAMRPWPGSFFEIDDLRLVVHEVTVDESQAGDIAGVLVADGDGIALSTGDGRLGLVRLQPAGGRPMGGPAFRRGKPLAVGARVR